MDARYAALRAVFNSAVNRAKGKGNERHAEGGEQFDQQIGVWIDKHIHSFALGQAVKKIHESQRMEGWDKIKELLDALVYVAMHIINVMPKKTETTEFEFTPLCPDK